MTQPPDRPVPSEAPDAGGGPIAAQPSDGYAELADLQHKLEDVLGAAAAQPAARPPLDDGQWAWDPETDALSVGPDMRRLLGWSEDGQRLGRDWFDSVHPDDRARHREILSTHLDGLSDRFACASRMLTIGGVYLWVFITGVALRNSIGRAQLMIGAVRPLSAEPGLHPAAAVPDGGVGDGLETVLRDVWLSGVAAIEARDREEVGRVRAEAANESQREFLATVSHEIRNPLSVIFGQSAIMQEAADAGAVGSLAPRISRIERASRHLYDLVNTVLDLSKAEAGQVEIELETFDLAALLREVEELGTALAERGGNRFAVDLAGASGEMRSDRLKLRQILINLVSNATKFTDQGTIALSVRPEGAQGERIRFRVADSGIGIPADRLDRLFRAFSQADATAARQRGGTGLGLFLCERYARLLGGTIEVRSRIGEGSVFEIVLPRALVLAPEPGATPSADRRLVIGHTEEISSLDPHFIMRNTNFMLAQHIFDMLVRRDAQSRLAPGLAERWEPLAQGGWRFHLRQGVRFHDGSAFDAQDVLATFERLPRITGSTIPYASLIKPVVHVAAPAPHVVEVFTRGPHPLLPADLANIAIVNRRFAEALPADFDALTAAIGTGPFQVRRRQPGRSIALEAFAGHWAGRPDWDQVEFRLIDDEVASVSALIEGEVQLIDNVSPAQLPELTRAPGVELASCVTNRLWYLYLDQEREPSPFVTGRDGQLLAHNPLRDTRVRRAISLAIDRAFLTQRLLRGQALPAGDVAPPHVFGANPDLLPDRYDPLAAKALLAEAGYPDGFALTLHGSRDRSFSGAKACRAIAFMLNGIGIACRPEALPSNEFYARAARREFSFGLGGWGSITGETSYTLRILLAGLDESRGFGMANRGGYASPAFDALLSEAVTTLDETARRDLLRRASAIAIGDYGIIPVCWRISTWAMRKGIGYEPQADGSTQAGAARWRGVPASEP